ncbi:MAG: hypothetical protein NWP80_02225 [Candidatus Gracilibacteria bacterium]|nr:hypothetical protein [Candidatus Gracilibacteria bacterium]
MKKIIFFLTLSIIQLFGFRVYAQEGYCKISDSTPNFMVEYLSMLDIGLTNINTELIGKKQEIDISRDFLKLKNSINKSFFILTNWDYYFSYFNFFVVYPLSGDYSSEIWRDYKYLDNRVKSYYKYYDYILDNGYYDIDIKNFCSGIENCENIEGKSSDLVMKMIGSLEYLKDYYRKSITGSLNNTFDKNMILFANDYFENNFKDNYNSNTNFECSAKGGLLQKASKKIEEILNIQKKSKKGIQDMKDAIKLARGDSPDFAEIERDLLQKELSRQGIGGTKADAILKNLDKYNETGLNGFMDNNFIKNSFNYLNNSIANQIDGFSKSISDSFGEDRNTITAKFLMGNNDINQKNIEIVGNLRFIYNKELPFLGNSELNLENNISRLINMHNNINESVKILEGVLEISKKVCNSQAFGVGVCEY